MRHCTLQVEVIKEYRNIRWTEVIIYTNYHYSYYYTFARPKAELYTSLIVITLHVGSLLIRFLLKRTTFHCFMCYHCPFQHAHMGKWYMDITQSLLSKGQHCNNMQLLHRDTLINYRNFFCPFVITFTDTHYVQIISCLFSYTCKALVTHILCCTSACIASQYDNLGSSIWFWSCIYR